jgi:hypothetical protein
VLTLASSWIEAEISSRLSLECTLLICHSLYLQYMGLNLFNGGVNCPLIGKILILIFVNFESPSSPLKANRRFEGTYHLHHQGRRISQTRKQRKAVRKFLFQPEDGGTFLQARNRYEAGTRLIFRACRWRRHVPPKRQLTSNGIHDVISQKIELFVATNLRTSDPATF